MEKVTWQEDNSLLDQKIFVERALDLVSDYSNRSLRQTQMLFKILWENDVQNGHAGIGYTISKLFVLEYVLKQKNILAFDPNINEINKIISMLSEVAHNGFDDDYEQFKEKYNKLI